MIGTSKTLYLIMKIEKDLVIMRTMFRSSVQNVNYTFVYCG